MHYWINIELAACCVYHVYLLAYQINSAEQMKTLDYYSIYNNPKAIIQILLRLLNA